MNEYEAWGKTDKNILEVPSRQEKKGRSWLGAPWPIYLFFLIIFDPCRSGRVLLNPSYRVVQAVRHIETFPVRGDARRAVKSNPKRLPFTVGQTASGSIDINGRS